MPSSNHDITLFMNSSSDILRQSLESIDHKMIEQSVYSFTVLVTKPYGVQKHVGYSFVILYITSFVAFN